ncbi:MAG: hypothetical protein FWG84_06925 [Bacteroidales bacterium]|nr:hypothetical protein [Bacteroidales bacterium]
MITSISIRKNLFFAALAFICCSNALQAQDIITLKDGYEIQAKVLEIEDQIIKYKEFDNQEGPTYDIQKSDVFSIKYENGTKDIITGNTVEVVHVSVSPQPPLTYNGGVWQKGTPIKPKQVRETMSGNSEALQQYNSGKSLAVAGNIIAYPCSFLLGWDLGSRLFGKGNNVLLGVGIVGTATGILMSLAGTSQMKKSVSLYNASVMHGTTACTLNFGITGSGGVGLTLNF